MWECAPALASGGLELVMSTCCVVCTIVCCLGGERSVSHANCNDGSSSTVFDWSVGS